MNTDPNIVAEMKKHLPEDIILWTGRPDPISYMFNPGKYSAAKLRKISIIFVLALLVSRGLALLGVVGIWIYEILVTIEVILVFMTGLDMLKEYVVATHTIYAVTDKGLVIRVRPRLVWKGAIARYEKDHLTELETSFDIHGRGNLVFSRTLVEDEDGERDIPVGFWGIEDVIGVKEIVKNQFHIE